MSVVMAVDGEVICLRLLLVVTCDPYFFPGLVERAVWLRYRICLIHSRLLHMYIKACRQRRD